MTGRGFAGAAHERVGSAIVDGPGLRRGGNFTVFDHAKIVAPARAAAEALRDKAQ